MKVAVVITCCNEEAYIAQAVRSVTGQTDSASVAEIVVVVDGSKDGSRQVLAELAREDSRIRILHAQGVGVPAARNLDRGIDIVGDVYDPSFQEECRRLRPKTVVCCNILEHVTDPAGFARIVSALFDVDLVEYVHDPAPFGYRVIETALVNRLFVLNQPRLRRTLFGMYKRRYRRATEETGEHLVAVLSPRSRA